MNTQDVEQPQTETEIETEVEQSSIFEHVRNVRIERCVESLLADATDIEVCDRYTEEYRNVASGEIITVDLEAPRDTPACIPPRFDGAHDPLPEFVCDYYSARSYWDQRAGLPARWYYTLRWNFPDTVVSDSIDGADRSCEFSSLDEAVGAAAKLISYEPGIELIDVRGPKVIDRDSGWPLRDIVLYPHQLDRAAKAIRYGWKRDYITR